LPTVSPVAAVVDACWYLLCEVLHIQSIVPDYEIILVHWIKKTEKPLISQWKTRSKKFKTLRNA
jgi:hypothetical protein